MVDQKTHHLHTIGCTWDVWIKLIGVDSPGDANERINMFYHVPFINGVPLKNGDFELPGE